VDGVPEPVIAGRDTERVEVVRDRGHNPGEAVLRHAMLDLGEPRQDEQLEHDDVEPDRQRHDRGADGHEAQPEASPRQAERLSNR
jgi:hypothetical protein